MKIMSSVSKRIARERSMLECLQALKSALMSVLLTGELGVRPDPEPPPS